VVRLAESDFLRIEVHVEVDEHKARRIEADLYNLLDVLLVERPIPVRDIGQATHTSARSSNASPE
jgi:hypothetical protein